MGADEDGAGRGIGRIMAGQNFSGEGAQGVWVRFPSATRWMPRAWLNTGAICGPKPATIWVPQTGDRCAERDHTNKNLLRFGQIYSDGRGRSGGGAALLET